MIARLMIPGLVFGVTAVATMGVLWGSKRWGVVDVPNERSAHVMPTPTMGGIAINIGIFAGALMISLPWAQRSGLLLVLAVLLIAVADNIGRPLAVGGKLVLQLAAASSWVIWAPAAPIQLTTEMVLAPGVLTAAISVIWLLWVMNVFNFMDGIDGFTGSQTIAMCVGLALLLPMDAPLGQLPPVVMAACLGFLLFNLPPARVFMGDVGSLSLGFMVGVMVLAVVGEGVSLWLAAMPLTLYFADTTYTVIRRFQRGDNVLRAHREHLYQRLVQAGWSHLQVDGAAVVVTGLFVAAAVSGADGAHPPAVICVAVGVLVLLAGLWWKEGRPHV
ncbi:MAG: glycosyltransferase family 4 protein [bacterium]|nr:glycosyltransferase family 4 protein [bacterium]